MRSASERRWLPASLAMRLLLAYLGLWLLTAGLVAGGMRWWLGDAPDARADHVPRHLAQDLAARMRLDGAGRPLGAAWPEDLPWLAEALPQDLGWRVVDGQGRSLLWSSAATQSAWLAAGLQADTGLAAHAAALSTGRLHLHAAPIGAAAPGLWLQVGVSERLVDLLHRDSVRRAGGTLVATVAVSVALLGLALWLTLRHLLQPVRDISRQAHGLVPGRTGLRLQGHALPQELRPLVEGFNTSLQRLEDAHARHLRFLADAAHELKTPLALLRAQVELGDSPPSALLPDIDHLTRQVQQWLVLAEVTEPQSYHLQPVCLVEVARGVCARLAPLAARHGTWITLQAPAAIALQADAQALAVLLKNLVENAIGFAPAGSAVTVTLDATGLRVADTGPGIAPEHLPRLFDRFWRGPERRDSGAGLGLAICQEVARRHGWRLQARNARPGAEFEVSLDAPMAGAGVNAC